MSILEKRFENQDESPFKAENDYREMGGKAADKSEPSREGVKDGERGRKEGMGEKQFPSLENCVTMKITDRIDSSSDFTSKHVTFHQLYKNKTNTPQLEKDKTILRREQNI